jgi:hypothetical protein
METKHERQRWRRVRLMRWWAGILTVAVAMIFLASCAGLVLWIPEPEPLFPAESSEGGEAIESSLVLGESNDAFLSRMKTREDRDMSGEELSHWFERMERDIAPANHGSEAGVSDAAGQ